jgi:hypothetical protein
MTFFALNFLPVILLVADIIRRYQMPRIVITIVVSGSHFSHLLLTAAITNVLVSVPGTQKVEKYPAVSDQKRTAISGLIEESRKIPPRPRNFNA